MNTRGLVYWGCFVGICAVSILAFLVGWVTITGLKVLTFLLLVAAAILGNAEGRLLVSLLERHHPEIWNASASKYGRFRAIEFAFSKELEDDRGIRAIKRNIRGVILLFCLISILFFVIMEVR